MAKFPKYVCYRVDLHADGLDSDGHLQCTISMEEVNKMLMFDGVDMPTCCRECPVREENHSLGCDKVRCRISDNWNDIPDALPDWCPAQAVEPVERIINGAKNPPDAEVSALLTNSQKFCKMEGDENNGKF